MTLQLHRPDGKGGLEPRPVAEQDWRRPATLAALGRRPWARAACPSSTNPEMNPTSVTRSIAFWLVLAPQRSACSWSATARASGASPADRAERRCGASQPPSGPRATARCPVRLDSRAPRLYCIGHAGIPVPLRRLERSRSLKRIQPFVDATNAPRARDPGALRRGDPRPVRRRSGPRSSRSPSRTSRPRTSCTIRTSSAAARSPRRAASARTTASRRRSTTSCPRSSRWPARRCGGPSGCASSTSSSSAASSSTRARSPR